MTLISPELKTQGFYASSYKPMPADRLIVIVQHLIVIV
ncbi:Uncharacterized protein conserved in archaea (DUF531) [Methanosarcina sp. WWM596]|nr:Uncharacterized protein conserved in archaea (DUF531) [Methanosarcina sp. WWM596]AKB21917.1 Uncharacterized protein conserved in archaea (DUF531) [Methanosarcina sp. WH1]